MAIFISESSSESERIVRPQAEIDQLGMLRVVVMLLRFHARRRACARFRPSCPFRVAAACTMCASSSTENCSVNWLNTRHSPGAAGFRQAISMQRTVSRISRNPRVWPPLPYTVKGCPDRGLHAEAVQHGAENFVVIEAIDQRFIQRDFVGDGSVHHALIQIRGAHAPDSGRRTSCCGCHAPSTGDRTNRAAWGRAAHRVRPLCSILI